MASFLLKSVGLGSPPKTPKATHAVDIDTFEKLWYEFDSFYQAIIMDDQRVLKKALNTHKSLLRVPEIRVNLSLMSKRDISFIRFCYSIDAARGGSGSQRVKDGGRVSGVRT